MHMHVHVHVWYVHVGLCQFRPDGCAVGVKPVLLGTVDAKLGTCRSFLVGEGNVHCS